jgi:cation diffusion facilitator family transporter
MDWSADDADRGRRVTIASGSDRLGRVVARAAESRRTVVVALGANLAVALVKLVGAVVSGSSALLAEAGHSIADCLNELFLLVGLARGGREPTPLHPFGFGRERFFWSLLTAVAIFVTGSVVAISEGVRALVAADHRLQGVPVALAALGVGAIADSVSLSRAVTQLRSEGRSMGLSLFGRLRTTTDPSARTIVLEDGAGLLGVTIAAAGLGMNELTGDVRWDAGASIMIGMLLAAIALEIGRDSQSLLIGEAAHPEEVAALRAVLDEYAGSLEVVDLETVRIGPDELVVAAWVGFADHLSAGDVEQLADQIEQEMIEAVPAVAHVFLDPTRARPPVPADHADA